MTTKSATANQTVIVLPESSGNILCVQFSGIITLDDHKILCDDPLRRIVDTYGSYRFFAHYKNFKGWTPEAAEQNFTLINDIHTRAERLAYVNPPERKVLQVSLQRNFLPSAMRFFNDSELQEALLWIQGA